MDHQPLHLQDPLHYEIPQRPDEYGIPPVLTVLLGRLFGDEDKCAKMRYVAYNTMQFAYPGHWPRFVYLQDLDEAEYGSDGTITDIYLASRAAKSSGWKAVTFLDSLSWRQHTRSTLRGEDPALTAIVVNLECVPSESVFDTTYFIRRLPIMMAFCEAMAPTPQKHKDWNQVSPQSVGAFPTMSAKMYYGFYLRNPFAPPFADHVEDQTLPVRKLSQQILNLKPRLPEELKIHIEHYLRQDAPLEDLINTEWRPPTTEKVVVVYCLVEVDHEGADAIMDHIPYLRNSNWDAFEVFQWRANHRATRRDIARIMCHFAKVGQDRMVFVLDRPRLTGTWDRPLVTFVETFWNPVMNLSLQRGEADTLSAEILDGDVRGMGGARWKFREMSPGFEQLLDPRWTFPRSQPQWCNQGHGHDISAPNAVVFCLTNALTREEKKIVMKELHFGTIGPQMYPKTYTVISWNKSTDGGPEDMLRLLKMCQWERGVYENYHALTFVDRQSSKDKKVLVCAGHYIDKHRESGIDYGRLAGRRATDCVMGRKPGNNFLREFLEAEGERVHFFRDPGYDGPLS